MITIRNEKLTVAISELGAEIQSIKRNDTGFEYIWQGDAKYWTGHAPLLFPMCGKEANGTFRMDGRNWQIEKHGFARKSTFSVAQQTDSEVSLLLVSDDTTAEVFPRQFELTVIYMLDGDKLNVSWNVKNIGRKAMPFQIGAHPAFNIPDWNEGDDVHGYMTFNVADKLLSDALTENGLRSTTQKAFEVTLDEKHSLPLTNRTFECDTILDTRGVLTNAVLCDKNRKPVVSVDFDMPVLALWSPNGGCAPFVCIEPWCGCCDFEGYDGLFADRDIVNSLLSNETFHNTYTITFAE